MRQLALSSLQATLNAYIALDPHTIEKLSALNGNVIAVNIKDWQITLFFQISQEQFILLSDCSTPNTTISGRLMDLIKVSCAKGDTKALFKHAVEISGDTELGQQFQTIFNDIDIDWEEHLSKLVGDIAAHSMSVSLQKIINVSRHAIKSLGVNIKEYLQIESHTLVSSQSLETFHQAVMALQNDVDRAEMRLNHLSQQVSK